MKQSTIERCRIAFDILTIMLDRQPSQREVSRAAPASNATVSAVWDDISGEVEPPPIHVQTTRRCLVCQNPFVSKWVGSRVCPRCKGLDAWKDGAHEYSSIESLSF